jgi:hypothetical protein
MRLACLAVLLLSGCPCGGFGSPDYLSFGVARYSVGPKGEQYAGIGAPLWGETEMMSAATDEIQIVFSHHERLLPDVVEVWSGMTRHDFAGEDSFVPENTEGCDHNERHYALSQLAVGDYTLVHRRAKGTGDPLNCGGECPWTRFDGDEAVTLTLAVR